MLQLLLGVNFSKERACGPLQQMTSALLLSEVLSVLSPSFYTNPLLLFYFIVFTAENCPGNFNELDFRSSSDSKTAHVFVQPRVGFS